MHSASDHFRPSLASSGARKSTVYLGKGLPSNNSRTSSLAQVQKRRSVPSRGLCWVLSLWIEGDGIGTFQNTFLLHCLLSRNATLRGSTRCWGPAFGRWRPSSSHSRLFLAGVHNPLAMISTTVIGYISVAISVGCFGTYSTCNIGSRSPFRPSPLTSPF